MGGVKGRARVLSPMDGENRGQETHLYRQMSIPSLLFRLGIQDEVLATAPVALVGFVGQIGNLSRTSERRGLGCCQVV